MLLTDGTRQEKRVVLIQTCCRISELLMKMLQFKSNLVLKCYWQRTLKIQNHNVARTYDSNCRIRTSIAISISRNISSENTGRIYYVCIYVQMRSHCAVFSDLFLYSKTIYVQESLDTSQKTPIHHDVQ
jgi:hypothetical protein